MDIMDINKVHSEAGFWDGDKGGDSDMENTDLLENHGNMVSPSEDTESQTESDSFAGENQPMIEMDDVDLQSQVAVTSDFMVSIERPAQTNDHFRQAHDIHKQPQEPWRTRLCRYIRKRYRCSGQCLKESMLKHVPIIETLHHYQWKSWLVSDIISGVSVGVIHIPQGMGFALLTGVPAVYGLYSSIFPIWVYTFFGTSKHISVGTMALISLMIGAVVNREAASLAPEAPSPGAGVTMATMVNESGPVGDEAFRVGIAMSVTLMMGLFQLLMWFCNLGVLATYMSMPFISAFMTGAALHIITSQVPPAFGLKLQRFTGTFSVPRTWVEVFINIADTNIAALITTAVCITILMIIKELINDRVKKYIKVPIPAELIVVIAGTATSYLAKFNERFNMKIIGSIPRGIPAPAVPTMHNAASYIPDSIVVAVVGFAIAISMAKLVSKRQGYSIDTNQELLAYGLHNAVGAFFHSFGGTQAPPRTLVCESTAGKTQLSGFISTILPLLVCLALGPLFEHLPNCVLAAIIIVALLPLLKSFKETPNFWRVNKIDFLVYYATVIFVTFFSIVIGLIVGIAINILLIIIQMQLAKVYRVRGVPGTEVYLPEELFGSQLQQDSKIQVFRLDSDLFFANVEQFKQRLFEQTASPSSISLQSMQLVTPALEVDHEVKVTVESDDKTPERSDSAEGKEEDRKGKEGGMEANVNNNQGTTSDDDDQVTEVNVDVKGEANHTATSNGIHKSPSIIMKPKERAIILDCSSITYIDIMGLSVLSSLKSEYAKVNTAFVLACCKEAMISKLLHAGMISPEGTPEKDKADNIKIFPTVIDAVETFRQRQSCILKAPQSQDSICTFKF